MLRIELPEHLDQMKDKRKKQTAWALKNLSRALYVGDEKTAQDILTKFNLKILNGRKITC
jgi:hypothetical protein